MKITEFSKVSRQSEKRKKTSAKPVETLVLCVGFHPVTFIISL